MIQPCYPPLRIQRRPPGRTTVKEYSINGRYALDFSLPCAWPMDGRHCRCEAGLEIIARLSPDKAGDGSQVIKTTTVVKKEQPDWGAEQILKM
jgi:hypothetical protein